MTHSLSSTTVRSDSPSGVTAVVRAFVVVAMVIASLSAVISLVEVFSTSSLVTPLSVDIGPSEIDADLPPTATVSEASAAVDVTIGLGYRMLWWLVTDALAIAGVAFLELFRRLLGTVSDPFTEANAGRLKAMAGLTLVFATVGLVRGVVAIAIQDAAGFDSLGTSFGLGSLALGLVLIALLEFWRRGIELRADAELTV